jgi:hypothetical protein
MDAVMLHGTPLVLPVHGVGSSVPALGIDETPSLPATRDRVHRIVQQSRVCSIPGPHENENQAEVDRTNENRWGRSEGDFAVANQVGK